MTPIEPVIGPPTPGQEQTPQRVGEQTPPPPVEETQAPPPIVEPEPIKRIWYYSDDNGQSWTEATPDEVPAMQEAKTLGEPGTLTDAN